LEEEVKKSPDRLDIKFKLADAYHGARNVHAMEGLMKQMKGAGVDRINPVQWERLGTMLQDLKGAQPTAPDLDSIADVPPPSRLAEPAQRSAATFPPTTFPSVGDQFSGLSARDSVPSAEARRDAKDLDLGVSELGLAGNDEYQAAIDEAIETTGSASDLELKLEDLESLEDVDLTSLSEMVSPIDSVSTEVLSEPDADSKVSSLDISPVSKDTAGSEFLSSQWQADSGIWDEVATKLDLARAYIEMDDPGAARVILDEVVQEGTEDQRAAARSMMDQLG
jgi:pilus assembly protein FimV